MMMELKEYGKLVVGAARKVGRFLARNAAACIVSAFAAFTAYFATVAQAADPVITSTVGGFELSAWITAAVVVLGGIIAAVIAGFFTFLGCKYLMRWARKIAVWLMAIGVSGLMASGLYADGPVITSTVGGFELSAWITAAVVVLGGIIAAVIAGFFTFLGCKYLMKWARKIA